MKINHSPYFFNHRLYAGYDQAKKNFQENIPIIKQLCETFFLKLATLKAVESALKKSFFKKRYGFSSCNYATRQRQEAYSLVIATLCPSHDSHRLNKNTVTEKLHLSETTQQIQFTPMQRTTLSPRKGNKELTFWKGEVRTVLQCQIATLCQHRFWLGIEVQR